jgi:hypothetical protein
MIMKKYQITHANGDVSYTDSKREAEALMREGGILGELDEHLEYKTIAVAKDGYIIASV